MPKEICVRLKWKIPHGHKKGHKELRSGHPDQCLNNMTHGQNLSSTSGESEFAAQLFFEIPASDVDHLISVTCIFCDKSGLA